MRSAASMAFTLTMVPRWICQNCSGSSPPSKSFSGVRTSASEPASTTRVYLVSAWKNSTSSISIRRICLPTLALIHFIFSRGGAGKAARSDCNKLAMSAGCAPSLSRSRASARCSRSACTGFNR